jgi:phosphoribosylaminoimidazole carboxylase PurE protein
LSKQLFRDCVDMEVIADKYALVAALVQKFVVPRQALVVWRGSEKDVFPGVMLAAGIEMRQITLSGHKATVACLDKLEELLANYPDGGVIITTVGMSNGLGPMLAAHTSWPVIAVPNTAKERPHDAWSSLEVPSGVPLATILSSGNAVLAALNILAQKNPLAYMLRQYAIEGLDQ